MGREQEILNYAKMTIWTNILAFTGILYGIRKGGRRNERCVFSIPGGVGEVRQGVIGEEGGWSLSYKRYVGNEICLSRSNHADMIHSLK
jgi:hypothetical protein